MTAPPPPRASSETASDEHREEGAVPPFNTLLYRFRALPAPRLTDQLHLEPGSLTDYHHLAPFHYRSAVPGAVTAVFRLVHHAPTIAGRYLHRRDETTTVGVLLRSLPALSCRLRDIATQGRYGALARRDAAVMLNREIRTISRVVIDPRWRGLGLAVRLVRHALHHPETMCTEALAAMGRVHPFFERAGMTRYDRPPLPHHARLLDALDRLALPPYTLAATDLFMRQLRAADASAQRWFEHELRHWHRAAFHTPRRALAALLLPDLLRAARDRLLSQPVYYFADHRDATPDQLPRS